MDVLAVIVPINYGKDAPLLKTEEVSLIIFGKTSGPIGIIFWMELVSKLPWNFESFTSKKCFLAKLFRAYIFVAKLFCAKIFLAKFFGENIFRFNFFFLYQLLFLCQLLFQFVCFLYLVVSLILLSLYRSLYKLILSPTANCANKTEISSRYLGPIYKGSPTEKFLKRHFHEYKPYIT